MVGSDNFPFQMVTPFGCFSWEEPIRNDGPELDKERQALILMTLDDQSYKVGKGRPVISGVIRYTLW